MTKVLAPIAPTWSDIVKAYSQVLGNPKWKAFSAGEIDLSSEEMQNLVAAVLGDRLVNTTNLKALHAAMREKDQNGFSLASSFPELFKIVEDFLREKGVVPETETKKDDGFQRSLIDPQAAIDRVAAVYRAMPRGADDPKLLQLALGKISLDHKSVVQLWFALAYWYKEILKAAGAGSEIMPQPSRWIMACCCSYINTRHIAVPASSGLSSAEYIAFRS